MDNYNLKAILNKDGSITATWSPVPGATRYGITIHIPPNEGYVYFSPALDSSVISHTSAAGLKEGITYEVLLFVTTTSDGKQGMGEVQISIPYYFYDYAELGVPADITATPSNRFIDLRFRTVNHATNYDILFDGKLNNIKALYNENFVNKRFDNLTPKTNHTYSVRAKSLNVTGPYSKTVTIKTLPNTPAAPAGVSKKSKENEVTLTWNAVSEATGYDVLFNGTTYPVAGTSKTITGLKPNTSYTYAVRSKNAEGSGSYSVTGTVTTSPSSPPTPIIETNENSVTISWNAVAGAVSYDVIFKNTTYNVIGTSKKFSGLLPNEEYTYQIRSNNADGSSSYSASKKVNTSPIPPAEPSVTATADSVTISWKAVAGATSYDVKFNDVTYNLKSTTKSFIGLKPGTSYSYSIRSKNEGGSSSYSPELTITTIPKAPSMPLNITATATADSATITWNPVTGPVSYEVTFDGIVRNVSDAFITITGLKPDTIYYYTVRAKNAGGTSSSYTNTIRTLVKAPGAPASVSATATTNSVTVSWSNVNEARSYDILFDGIMYNASGLSRTFAGLASGTNHTYAVRSNNVSGSSSYSTTKSIQTTIAPLAVPAYVNATATTNTVTVSWGSVYEAASYDLLFNGTTYNLTGTSNTFTGLVRGANYTYAVRARNALTASPYSVTQTIRTTPYPPAMPANVSASATSDSVTVNWYAVSGATSYHLIFNGTTYYQTGLSKKFTGLESNTSYPFSVRANNEGGSSAYTPSKTVKTLLDIPSNITAAAGVRSITLSWGAVAGASGYDVNLQGKIYYVSGTSKEFDGLTPKTSYTYAIRAKNASELGLYSQSKSVSTLADIPDTPSDMSAVSTINSVSVSWSPVNRAVSYDIGFDGEFYNVPGTSKRFTGLKPNTKHSYTVRTNNDTESSPYSPVKTISTKISKKSGLPNAGNNKKYPDGKIPHMGLDPVNALTGAFLWSHTYLEEHGKDPLDFTVMYDSQRDECHRSLGEKWTYSLNYLLYMDDEYAYFSTPYDEVVPFAKNEEGGGFQLAEGMESDYSMGRKGDGSYFVRDIDGTEYVFKGNLSLSQIIEGGHVAYRFRSNGEGLITGMEGRRGGAFTLEYTGGHISKVTDSMGNAAAFTYANGRLATAINPAGDSMSFSYDDTGNLLEIKDFSGAVHVTNRYDSQGRVVGQNTAGRGNALASYDETNGTTTFTDELGNATKYTYDRNQRVTSVELAGTSVQSEYDEKGRLAKQTDALGNATEMSYDEYGRMQSVTYPDGTRERIEYNAGNHPVRLVNRDGSESAYEYDPGHNMTGATDERGNTSRFAYDAQNNLKSHRDRNGNVWTYAYDGNHHLKQAADPEGNIHKYAHDAIGRLLSFTSPGGLSTAWQYSAAGDLLKIVDADGTVAFEYDENGGNTGVTDRLGNKQRLEYNGMGQVTLATDFAGNEYRFEYDRRGSLVKETDPLGYSRSYTYDAMGNNTGRTDKNGNASSHAFDAVGQLTEVTDPAGNKIRYAYDTMGRVKLVTDPLGGQTGYAHDAAGRVTGVTNALGHVVAYAYDEAGNLLSETDENGVITSYTYEKENRLESIKTELGTIRFSYDPLGRLTAVEDLDGGRETAEYDADGNLLSASGKEGGRTTYAYDQSGRLCEETDANGGRTLYEYDANGSCTKITDAEGGRHAYGYDANGRLTMAEDPMGHTTSYEYDGAGNPVSVTDQRGGKTLFAYDGNGNLLKETNPLGGERTYVYDALNRLVSDRDENGHERTYAYDANGNLTSYTDGNQNKWEFVYDALNRRTAIRDQEGGLIAISYGKKDEIARVTDQEGTETDYAYDRNGRLVGMRDGLGNSLGFAYDALGRVVRQTDARGNETLYEYSPTGNLLKVRDPEGNDTTYAYDAMGRVLTETNALGGVTGYTYDALGRTTSMTDPCGGKTSFTYTGSGEIATVTDANGGIAHYEYDGCGNLTRITDPLGVTVAYEYDAMNNQIKECLSTTEGQSNATLYLYDKKGQMVRELNPLSEEKLYTYDGNGNVVSILDEDGQETGVRYDLNDKPAGMSYGDGKKAAFRYNKRGELVELGDWNGTVRLEYGVTGRLSKVTDQNGRAVGYAYDANGNRTGMACPNGGAASYTYDRNNRMTKAVDAEGQETLYGYNPLGGVASRKHLGGETSYEYNGKGLPTRVRHELADGTHMETGFTYDAVGNILEADSAGSSPELTKKVSYTYDALGRLLSYGDGRVTESYGYDPLGNRIMKKVNGGREADSRYNVLNQLTERTENGIQYGYGYDKRGNLTEERRGGSLIRKYAYDATNHMVMGRNLESGEKSEYAYNALNMRVKNVQTLEDRRGGYHGHVGQPEGLCRTEAFRTREMSYLLDYGSGTNNELAAYEKGKGEVRYTYGPGYERVSGQVVLEAGVGKTFYQSDLLGSELFVSNGLGEALRYAERSAWGDLRIPTLGDENPADVGEGPRFGSYGYDPVLGKHFAQARFYDAGQGRMLARDPVKSGLNAYPYCGNNPVNYVDPTGEIANVAIGGAIGMVTGGIFGFAGSAISQGLSGGFSARRAIGSAVNGAVVGAVRGALVSTGVGIGAALGSNFAAGAVGSALEQMINGGKADLGQSVAGGLTNAVSGAAYGSRQLKSAGSAFLRGAGAGAATAGINNLSNAWNSRGGGNKGNAGAGGLGRTRSRYRTSPYAGRRNPKEGCGEQNPFGGKLGHGGGYGYRYGGSEEDETGRGGFSFVDLAKDMIVGSVIGGLGSLTFYGAGKAVEGVRRSVRKVRVERVLDNKGGSSATPGTSKLIGAGEGEQFGVYASKATPVEGYTDVIVHGAPPNEVGVMHNGKWAYLNQRSLSNYLKQDAGYAGGSIRLLSCATGSTTNGFAQNLANKMGVQVMAPSDTIWAFPNGKLTIGPKSFSNTGQWNIFNPGNH